MPIPTAQQPRQRDALRGFVGVNLRTDPLDLTDGDVVRAINADLHRKPGVAMMRLGSSARFAASLGDTITRIAKHNSRRYEIAGTTLFANETSILAGMIASPTPQIQPFRQFTDDTEWVYIAAGNSMQKYDGISVVNWGLSAPTTAPTPAVGAAVGVLKGTFTFVQTFARYTGGTLSGGQLIGGTRINESNPSPTSAAVTVDSERIDLTIAQTGSEAEVTHINIYRTAAGGSTHLLAATLENIAQTVTAAPSQDDSGLGTAVETDNDRPNNATWVTAFQGHLFVTRDPANPHYLWWSKRFREAISPSNFLEIGNPSDPIQCAQPLAGSLGVFTRHTKYRVTGNVTSGFIALEALSSRGTPACDATLVTSRGVIFPARDGIFLTNFLQEDTELSAAIEPLFYGETVNGYLPVDWDRADAMAMAEYKNRVYWSYPTVGGGTMMAVLSRHTGKWYFFDYARAYTALYFEEDTDLLIGGDASGTLAILEDATADGSFDSPTLTLEPATRAGQDRDLKKYFQFAKVDVDAKDGTVTVALVVDGVTVREVTLTGRRTRRLLRLPDRTIGYTWAIIPTTTTPAAEIYGASMQYIPLHEA